MGARPRSARRRPRCGGRPRSPAPTGGPAARRRGRPGPRAPPRSGSPDDHPGQAIEGTNKLPDSATVDLCLILDPMLATGGSATAAIEVLKRWGAVHPVRIKLVNLIAAPEGVEAVAAAHPHVEIPTAAPHPPLNDKGYIMPGLGDAGDRQFGTGLES